MNLANTDSNNKPIVYQEGDSPRDKEQAVLSRDGLISLGTGILSVYSLGTIGIALVSPIGLFSLVLAIGGFACVGVDYVLSMERWEKEDGDLTANNYQSVKMMLTDEEPETQNLPYYNPDETNKTRNETRVESNINREDEVKVILPSKVVDQPKVTLSTSTTHTPIKRPTALSLVLADPFESRAYFGAQRTGKSYFAATSSENLSHNGVNIYHINLASYTDPATGINEDTQYWQHVKDSVCCDISCMDGFDAGHYIVAAVNLIHKFYLDPQPSILIVDEIAYIGATGNQHSELLKGLLCIIADKITTLSSSGKKRKKAIWTIAPEFVAGSLTQDAKAIKKLSLCYVTIHPKKTVDWDGQAIGFSDELYDQIKNNYSISDPESMGLPDEDRLVYMNKQWLPIGELKRLGDVDTVDKNVTNTEDLDAQLEDLVSKVHALALDLGSRGLDNSDQLNALNKVVLGDLETKDLIVLLNRVLLLAI